VEEVNSHLATNYLRCVQKFSSDNSSAFADWQIMNSYENALLLHRIQNKKRTKSLPPPFQRSITAPRPSRVPPGWHASRKRRTTMPAHTLHDTQSCYPVCSICRTVPPTFPANLVVNETYVIPPERKNFISKTPSSLPAIKPLPFPSASETMFLSLRMLPIYSLLISNR
jgi:hypothetical protein